MTRKQRIAAISSAENIALSYLENQIAYGGDT